MIALLCVYVVCALAVWITGWQHAPSIIEPFFGPSDCLESMELALAYAERWTYQNGLPAEGVVFKRRDGGFSFEIISNAFLLKYGI